MSTIDHLRAFARVYSQPSESIRVTLPEHGKAIEGQMAELSKRPSAERCEIAARYLEAVRWEIMRYAERLRLEGEGVQS